MNDLFERLRNRALAALDVLGDLQIAHALLVDPTPSAMRDAEFGLITLKNGRSGLYYAWLGGDQEQLPERGKALQLEDSSVAALLDFLASESDAERSLGIAAVNAITASLYQQADYRPPRATDAFGELSPRSGDVLGMIGNFPPLVRQAHNLGLPVHVVEKKQHMLREEDNLVISLDPNVLNPCNKIVCTGATLINQSFQSMLEHCPPAAAIALVGPTVGCFPDDFFERGVYSLAGAAIDDGWLAHETLAAGGRLGDVSHKTTITRSNYPGFDTLISRAADKTPAM